MMLGMSLFAFTLLHVVISLIGIVSGFVVVFGFISGKKLDGWNTLFLATTVLTSVTGYMFPFEQLLPSHIVGAISLVVLAIALSALYQFRLAGRWRSVYVVTASVALYFNSFVGVVQAFQKVPVLKAMAPTQAEPPFLVAQLALLAVFILLGTRATKNFRTVAAV
jgi:hypothetical protein